MIDGDTIDATIQLGFGVQITERLRLAGIQAPEIFGTPADSPQYARGIQAKEFVEKRLRQNERRFRVHTTKRGKWRRWLADIHLDDSDHTLNRELVANKLAVDYETYLKKKEQRTTVRTMFEMERELKDELQDRAEKQGITPSQLIRKAVEEYLR